LPGRQVGQTNSETEAVTSTGSEHFREHSSGTTARAAAAGEFIDVISPYTCNRCAPPPCFSVQNRVIVADQRTTAKGVAVLIASTCVELTFHRTVALRRDIWVITLGYYVQKSV
jgi:hypothetical protein